MRLKNLEINGFKSFAQKINLEFETPIVCIVGPNGSGKSNIVESFRFVLGEQSLKSMRGKSGPDFIFKGSKNLPKSSIAKVSIYFNNSDKIFKFSNGDTVALSSEFDLNYETISISREVYADGMNRYILNGTEVRLKDISNLLSSVNVGSSGYHIISQGEADQILNANPKDCREMIADSLGLKIYQIKIKESQKKIELSDNNLKEITLLRRENVPHLNFLKKQIEKFNEIEKIQFELLIFYKEYLKNEDEYLKKIDLELQKEKNNLLNKINGISDEIKIAEESQKLAQRSDLENSKRSDLGTNLLTPQITEAEINITNLQKEKNELERKLGRIEGILESKEKLNIPNQLAFENSEKKCPLCGTKLFELSPEVSLISENHENHQKELLELKNSQNILILEIEKIFLEEEKVLKLLEILKKENQKEIEQKNEIEHAREKELFDLKIKYKELSSALDLINIKENNLKTEKENFENEIKEGLILVGSGILNYENYATSDAINDTNTDSGAGVSIKIKLKPLYADRNIQNEIKRKLERMKLKLEEFNIGDKEEITKEFKETSERDVFLAKEIEDLNKSIELLNKLISDLRDKIDLEFRNGIEKINLEFQTFFSLIFGGGSAQLSIISNNHGIKKKSKNKKLNELNESIENKFNALESGDENENQIIFEPGVEINISLPHKKVKELHALSGGERSLTSIALLFAMSQVNPSPFLVLDETDAALDEVNSRKFGDMLEKLSKNSQLIVITHNRETMSRAGILYGITVGQNGASKLLSIKLEEAVAIAK